MNVKKITVGKLRLAIFILGGFFIGLGAVAVFVFGDGEVSRAMVPLMLLTWLILVVLIIWYFILTVRAWFR